MNVAVSSSLPVLDILLTEVFGKVELPPEVAHAASRGVGEGGLDGSPEEHFFLLEVLGKAQNAHQTGVDLGVGDGLAGYCVNQGQVVLELDQDVVDRQQVRERGARLVHGGPGLHLARPLTEVSPVFTDVIEARGVAAEGDRCALDSVFRALGAEQLLLGEPVEEGRHAAAGVLVVDLLGVLDDGGASIVLLAEL